MAKRKRGRWRHGLLTRPGIAPTEKEAGEIPGAEVPGQEVPPIPPAEPQTAFGDEEPKAWHKPCFFSCVPKGFVPVNVYNSDGTSLPAGGGPSSPPAWVTLAEYFVPQGKVFRWHKSGTGFGAGASGNVTFAWVVDNTPIGPGFGATKANLGALNVADMLPIDQSIVGPATVKIRAYNTSVAAKTAYARIFGYQGPNK